MSSIDVPFYISSKRLISYMFKINNDEFKNENKTKKITKTKKDSKILCRNCKNHITSIKNKIIISGSHEHTLFNPSGIVFNLACFKEAEGCYTYGQKSNEFTWFSGYAWQAEICNSCGCHLGWLFSSDDDSFHALIIKHLVF